MAGIALRKTCVAVATPEMVNKIPDIVMADR